MTIRYVNKLIKLFVANLTIMNKCSLHLLQILCMCPRPKNIRNVISPPKFKGFRPYGFFGKTGKAVNMFIEEYEAIKLCDYELLTQLEASKFMGVSRPTFTRIYESARRKIALALAETRQINFEGGKAHFNAEWFKCDNCSSIFNNPPKTRKVNNCPMCNSESIKRINDEIKKNIKQINPTKHLKNKPITKH